MLIEVTEKSKLYFLVNAFIGAYNRRTDTWKAMQQPVEGGTGGDVDFSEVINRLDFLTGQVTQLNTRQELVLNLVEDLATDPEAVKQAATRIKALRQQLQQSIDNHPKENS